MISADKFFYQLELSVLVTRNTNFIQISKKVFTFTFNFHCIRKVILTLMQFDFIQS